MEITPQNEQPAPVPPPAQGGDNTPPAPAPPDTATSAANAADSGEESEQGNEQPKSVAFDRCHTSMLDGSLQRGDPGAGQRYAELVLTNNSGEICTLYGYGGLQLVDSHGQPLTTNLNRSPSPGPVMIDLDPGESASKTLHWTAVPHEGEPTDGPCQPNPSGVQVIPPDETDPLSVSWTFGPVCGFGSIDGSAYHQ